MAAQLGLGMLVKVDTTGSGSFSTVGGGQEYSISFDGEAVDITSQDDASRWRLLLEGAGVKSAAVTLSGVFKDAAVDETVRGYKMAGSIREWQVVLPSFGTLEGEYHITNLTYSAGHNTEVKFSLSLMSAGVIAWTAA